MLLVSKMIYVYKLNGFVSCAPKFLNLTSKMELTVGQGLVLRLTINQPTVITQPLEAGVSLRINRETGGLADMKIDRQKPHRQDKHKETIPREPLLPRTSTSRVKQSRS